MAKRSRARKNLQIEFKKASTSSQNQNEEMEVSSNCSSFAEKEDDMLGNGEVLTPRESICALQQRSELHHNFSEWLSSIHSKQPVARIDWSNEEEGNVPILQLSDNSARNVYEV